MPAAYLGLGSNLGDRASNLRNAIVRLESETTHVCAVSSTYETEHVGNPGEQAPDYLNCVIHVETALPPGDLLALTQSIERELGRVRPFVNAPRTIDIDILIYDDVVTDTPALKLPHPRLRCRAFALAPLVELEPGIRFPDGSAAVDLLAGPAVAAQIIRRVAVHLTPEPARAHRSDI